MQKLITLLFATSALAGSLFATPVMASEHDHFNVEVERPWSRPTPPGTPMGVGYLVIRNHGDRDVRFISASTSRARHVSIHETLMKEGVMRMQPLRDGLAIPAGKAVELKPHSYHLMLEKLKEPLKAGEEIPLVLEFEGAEAVKTRLKVQPLDADMRKPEMDHSRHKMDH